MIPFAVHVRNAERMMTFANVIPDGLELAFADGCKGLVPFADIPEVATVSDLANIELPNPYVVVLRNTRGEVVELPWDFARHYCDLSYRPRAEALARFGRETLGKRVRQMRERVGITQEALAAAADIGRVTLVRIENGEQSPRFETLLALAKGLGCPIQDLLAESPA